MSTAAPSPRFGSIYDYVKRRFIQVPAGLIRKPSTPKKP
jgi:hypothetical protein